MKISYNWLNDFIDLNKSPEELSLILTDIGLEVESLSVVQAIQGGLEGLVIGEVLTCEQHPNADRLRVTTVDVGSGDPLSIVCGAPNVAKGQKVIVAGVGTTVYPVDGEAFKIKLSKIRGELSEGMICAEDEIGLGKSHEGIMVLPQKVQLGQLAKDYFEIQDDFVYEIGLTPNRADAASHLGVARDIAAFLRGSYSMPNRSDVDSLTTNPPIKVTVLDPERCPRYTSMLITGCAVKESPKWLKEKLQAIGLRPINNIVDVTNFVLHELGQPLHAFDADKVRGKHIIVRQAGSSQSFITLDEVERTLQPEDLMICDEEGPLCIAGVFGGISSGVSAETSSIFLESAYFNPVTVRKTAKRLGLKTDSSFRFERGTDPNMTLFAAQRAALLIQELAGGEIVSLADFYPKAIDPFPVTVSYKRVQDLIGKAIPKEEIKGIIEALEIKVTHDDGETLEVEVPPYKVDVTREVDIIEEVLRIYGYNNIEFKPQLSISLSPSPKPDKELVQNLVADFLVANGWHEILNNSLTKLAYADEERKAVKIVNPLSSDLDTMRQNLLFSGLEVIEYNQKRKSKDLLLFEFGKTYWLEGERYVETEKLSLFMTGKAGAEQWNNPANPISFFQLKGAVDGILSRLNLKSLQVEELNNEQIACGLHYHRGDQVLVDFGAVQPALLREMDVEGEVFYADIHWQAILKAIRKNKITYQEVSKFPAVRRDLALLVDQSISFSQLKAIAAKTEKKILQEVNVFDVYQGEKLPKGKKSYALSFIIQDEGKTLTDKQIDALVQKLIANFEREAGAEVRK